MSIYQVLSESKILSVFSLTEPHWIDFINPFMLKSYRFYRKPVLTCQSDHRNSRILDRWFIGMHWVIILEPFYCVCVFPQRFTRWRQFFSNHIFCEFPGIDILLRNTQKDFSFSMNGWYISWILAFALRIEYLWGRLIAMQFHLNNWLLISHCSVSVLILIPMCLSW